MKKDLGSKPFMYVQPVVMVASYDENAVPDIMAVAWAGLCDFSRVSLCIGTKRKTASNILKTKAFTISMATEKYIAECDFLGDVSGNVEPDKVKKSGLHVSKSKNVNAPVIDELPLCLECKLVSYDEEHGQVIGEIVNVLADESILDEDSIDMKKLSPLVFDISKNCYYGVSEKLADAHSIGNKLK